MVRNLSADVAATEPITGQGEQLGRYGQVGFCPKKIHMPEVGGEPWEATVQVHALSVPAREPMNSECVA
jgi:hypothetical protein